MKLFAWDDAGCGELAALHGTPCFAYRRSIVEDGFKRLRAALPPRVRLAYAVKANPHPDLLTCLARLGASFDCASQGELQRVSALRLPPGRCFFAGPGKRREELALALTMGVRVQAEGIEDLERLQSLALERGLPKVVVNLRVHPLGIEEGARILGGSGPSAFGVDEEAVPQLLEKLAGLNRIRIRGLHAFAASNQRDAAALLAIHERIFGVAQRLQETFGLPMDQVDLGGGLGVPYAADETPLDAGALGSGLSTLLSRNAWFSGEVILEPGRYLAAACGVYLAKVIRLKESRGTRFAILEGGLNHLLRPALTGQPFPVRAVGKSGPTHPTTLAGPLCTSLDRLGEVELPDLAPGDLLAFGMTGAYGFTEAMTHFLSHPVAPEVWVEG